MMKKETQQMQKAIVPCDKFSNFNAYDVNQQTEIYSEIVGNMIQWPTFEIILNFIKFKSKECISQ